MKIRIGTRKSRLALVQTDLVRQKIEEAFPGTEIEIVEMSTKGDELLDRSLTSFGGKGVFTKELEDALLREEIDLAVHSAKDMPMEFPEGLGIGAVLSRADVRDVLVTTSGIRAADLAPGSIVGTSSLRRELQIKEINPLVRIKLLRGNVQTRIRKLKEGQYDAILLAAAGMERLGITEEEGIHLEYLSPEELLPAAGQGILAVESKEGRLTEVLQAIHCPEAALELEAERSFLKAIGGSCNAPAAALSRLTDGKLCMKVLYVPEGGKIHRAEGSLALESSAEGRAAAAQEEHTAALDAARSLGRGLARKVKQGKVWLLGAGPGDMGLLTEKALSCIRNADVLVYDNLASAAILNEAKKDAELIYAGKRADRHHLRQEETNALLVEKALEGKNVARVKGGDPFIFGRGGEEAQELLKAGVEYEIVPGVSSSYAAPAYAGIPVTHRDYASSFHVITGHESASKEGTVLDYATLAKEEGTLVFLMGLKNLPHIASELMANGKAPKTPAAVIQEGTTGRQRTVTGLLENIADRAKEAGIQTPAITVVGGVAGLAEELSWYGRGPLSGVRVLLTGTPSMCEKQKKVLAEDGAEVIPFSLIDTKELERPEFLQAAEELASGDASYTWVVFTSRNGVEIFLKALKKQQIDIRKLASLHFAVIGEGTKAALEEAGIYADFVPSRYSSTHLAAEWIPELKAEDKVLLLRAEEASDELPKALAEAGIPYTDAALYRTERDYRKAEELNRLLPEMDYITFASASAVKAFAAMVPEPDKITAKAVCIGPVTEKAAVKAGIPVYASAVAYTAEGMRDVLRKDRKYGRV
ncbi:MAG TPA: hydroxymethylbilane synthase [Candidatus Merdisoma faecalis]|uniref:hydroxymethylbilane synthase n=1 Tax=Lachnoclostridium sp. An138 TaxID=1965560 RepID=UPI000B39F09A|nr:hydroxymethylbilane synthase [Lachnoclostridium sp. An138]OUQ20277.1 hypothetical protein B5E82_02095 [Lachnoclostridium sp. An138]HIR97672.1 hydroxymethylbilane synthase [Candidatus Merdisoma faecalis]